MLKNNFLMTITLILGLSPLMSSCSLRGEQTLESKLSDFHANSIGTPHLSELSYQAYLGISAAAIELILIGIAVHSRKQAMGITSRADGIPLFGRTRDPQNDDEHKFIEFADSFVDEECLKPSDDIFQNKVFIVISTNYTDPDFDVMALCSAIGISKTKCYNDIGLAFKKTPKELINDYRLTQGLILLKSSNKSIGEISSEIGFKSHSGFTKGFKKKFGFAPSQVVPFYHN